MHRMTSGCFYIFFLEPFSEIDLTAACGVTGGFNLLIYYTECCAALVTGGFPETVI